MKKSKQGVGRKQGRANREQLPPTNKGLLVRQLVSEQRPDGGWRPGLCKVIAVELVHAVEPEVHLRSIDGRAAEGLAIDAICPPDKGTDVARDEF